MGSPAFPHVIEHRSYDEHRILNRFKPLQEP